MYEKTYRNYSFLACLTILVSTGAPALSSQNSMSSYISYCISCRISYHMSHLLWCSIAKVRRCAGMACRSRWGEGVPAQVAIPSQKAKYLLHLFVMLGRSNSGPAAAKCTPQAATRPPQIQSESSEVIGPKLKTQG